MKNSTTHRSKIEFHKSFSKLSVERLKTCHVDLQIILNYVAQFYNFTVLVGHRDQKTQDELYKKVPKVTNVRWPNSMHNKIPSLAVDLIPYHIEGEHYRWEDLKSFAHFAGFVQAIATELYLRGKVDHVIRWGGDWDSDRDFTDQKLHDLPHLELLKPSQFLVQLRSSLEIPSS